MKGMILAVTVLSVSATYWSDSPAYQEDNEVAVWQTGKDFMTKFYQRYPLEVIPYSIPSTDYVLEAKVLSIETKKVEKAFTRSKDQYSAVKYESGLTVEIQYDIKNPYPDQMWIPIPHGLTITSKEYPKELDSRENGIHPNKSYYSKETRFVAREPVSKWDGSSRLYFLPSGSSLISAIKI